MNKMKFIKDKDVFADLEECFGELAEACQIKVKTTMQIVRLLTQLGAAVKPARARFLRGKLRDKLRELKWNADGKSCGTFEQQVQVLTKLVEDTTGVAMGKKSPSHCDS